MSQKASLLQRAIDRLHTVSDAVARYTRADRAVKWGVLGASALVLVVLVVVPLWMMLWAGVWSGYPGQFAGSFTLDNLVSVYVRGASEVIGLFSNSVLIAAGHLLVAGGFGLGFAWLFVRTNLPTKGLMELIILSPYAIPGYLYAYMYISTYGPEHGLFSRFLMDTFGLASVPFDLFSPWGIIVILGVDSVTSFYLITLPAVQDMNPSLEEVSRIHGASLFTTIRSISLPLLLPAIFSATLTAFVNGLGEFSVVEVLGRRAGFDVYATEIWEAVRLNVPPEYGQAAALSFSFLAVTLVLVWYYRKVTSRKEAYMTVTSHGYQPRTYDLGKWRWPLALCIWVVLLLLWVLPVVVLTVASLHGSWLGEIELHDITLQHYFDAFSQLQGAFTNSILVSLGAATIGTIIVVGVAYYTERTRARFRGVLDFLSLTPMAIPGIIAGAGMLFTVLWLGKLPFLDLYGTLWIIILGSIIIYIPTSSRIAVGNIVQVHSELEEAAHIYGASWLQQMREIFLPLFRNTVFIIWFYLLIHVFQQVSVAIMVYTSDTRVIPVELFFLYVREAQFGVVSAASIMFVAITMLLLVAMRLLGIRFYETQ